MYMYINIYIYIGVLFQKCIYIYIYYKYIFFQDILSSLFMVPLDQLKFLLSMKLNLLICSITVHSFFCPFKKWLYNPRSWRYSPVLYFQKVCHFTFHIYHPSGSDFCVWWEVGVKDHFLSYEYLFFCPKNGSGSFVIDQVTVYVSVCVWILFCSIGLSILAPMPHTYN